MRGVLRAAIAVSVVPLLGFAAVAALESGVETSRARIAGEEFNTWLNRAGRPLVDTARSVRLDLDRLSATRNTAVVEELKGLLALHGDEGAGVAAGHFKEALSARPTSPYTWSNLLRAQYEAGMTGPEFESALANAVRLGRWEPAVQNTVVDLGLAVRDELSPAGAAAVDSMIAAAIRRNPLETLQIAERRGRLALVCSTIAGPFSDPSGPYSRCRQWERTT
jgi:hypothetical protein